MAKKKNEEQPSLFPEVLYDERFLDSHAGKHILHDPKTAVVELIANAWDAGATDVKILWPISKATPRFSIQDNGTGMTNAEFNTRWRTLNYNRQDHQGSTVTFPDGLKPGQPDRTAFGRNGIGRWSGFCFGKAYVVDTHKDQIRNRYQVTRGVQTPFEIKQEITDEKTKKHGTTIECLDCHNIWLSPDDVRGEIGMRFLTDPNFRVSVNGEAVSFEDINNPNIETLKLKIRHGITADLIVIDTQASDRTTKQHGVAWHVGGRLVGTCSWRGVGPEEDLIDGRRIAAKRFTFIVRADHLANAEAIKKDWSGFDRDNEQYQEAAKVVYDKVREYLLSASEDDRKETFAKAAERNFDKLKSMGPLQREKWADFVTQAQENCPSIKESDIVKLSEVVASLEQSKSGYALLHKLSEYGPDRIDELNSILADWTLDMAKAVLDEIGQRLVLVEELKVRIEDPKTQEVQDLQPLFERGLWIFGAEFETIEYTANESMTRVVQSLFKQPNMKGSRNRPDFAILPDGTSGLYSYPRYDSDGGEVGTDKLVIVELKKPELKIGEEQKAQCWKYVKELFEKGLLQAKATTVRCFVLGSHVETLETSPRAEMDGTVTIQPLLFASVLERAKSRLLKLHDRVKNAPFLESHREKIKKFLTPIKVAPSLFSNGSESGKDSK